MKDQISAVARGLEQQLDRIREAFATGTPSTTRPGRAELRAYDDRARSAAAVVSLNMSPAQLENFTQKIFQRALHAADTSNALAALDLCREIQQTVTLHSQADYSKRADDRPAIDRSATMSIEDALAKLDR